MMSEEGPDSLKSVRTNPLIQSQLLSNYENKSKKKKEEIKMLIQEYSDLFDQNESTDVKNEEVYKNIKVFLYIEIIFKELDEIMSKHSNDNKESKKKRY